MKPVTAFDRIVEAVLSEDDAESVIEALISDESLNELHRLLGDRLHDDEFTGLDNDPYVWREATAAVEVVTKWLRGEA